MQFIAGSSKVGTASERILRKHCTEDGH